MRLLVRFILIYFSIDMLKNEKSNVDLAGATLPSLKTLLEDRPKNKDALTRYTRTVHGILSSCLLNIDEMR